MRPSRLARCNSSSASWRPLLEWFKIAWTRQIGPRGATSFALSCDGSRSTTSVSGSSFASTPRQAAAAAHAEFHNIVQGAKARWVIERDYQELKQEIGLGHYEGRGWRGFHHHASLCIAAYGFLVAERCLFPLRPASPRDGSRHLRYPRVSSRVVPVRPERHVPHSIASIRRRLAVGLVHMLPRCPCCLQKQHIRVRRL